MVLSLLIGAEKFTLSVVTLVSPQRKCATSWVNQIIFQPLQKPKSVSPHVQIEF